MQGIAEDPFTSIIDIAVPIQIVDIVAACESDQLAGLVGRCCAQIALQIGCCRDIHIKRQQRTAAIVI
jgi:hypothetical protein